MGGIPLNTLDVIFATILCFFLIRGLYNGFLREIASILGLFIGFLLANKLYEPVVPVVQMVLEDEGNAMVVSYILVLMGTFMLVLLVIAMLRNVFQLTLLGTLDRFVGGTFGFFKGFLLCAIILLVMTTFLSSGSPTLSESKISPYINKATPSLSLLLPGNMQAEFGDKGQYLLEIWNKNWAEEIRKKHNSKI
ncbi:MAG: CvpA family protein [Desulfovibrionales bacterium]